MSFEDVMAAVTKWQISIEALAALGAELALKQSGEAAPPEIVAALRAVSETAGLGNLDELAPQQQAIAASVIRLCVQHAVELLENPAREAGWTYTDPTILDGWGRGSSMVPALIAGSHPDLAEVDAFLDVGTGVGLLAIAAASIWPGSTIVGVDRWEASLERARAHVTQAGLDDRITLRTQDVTELDDTDQYDCIWVPTFFLTEAAFTQALSRFFRAARPGGWIALGRYDPPPDPLARATVALRTIRSGGFDLDAERAVKLLEHAGCTSVHVPPRTRPVPLGLVLGQKPAR